MSKTKEAHRPACTKKWSCSFEPLETNHPDGTVTEVLDRSENRDAATRYHCVTVEQTQFVKQLVHQDILGKLFRGAETGSTQEQEGIRLLKIMLKEDLTIEEIIAQCGMKKSRVLILLRSPREHLRRIAEVRYNFRAEDL